MTFTTKNREWRLCIQYCLCWSYPWLCLEMSQNPQKQWKQDRRSSPAICVFTNSCLCQTFPLNTLVRISKLYLCIQQWITRGPKQRWIFTTSKEKVKVLNLQVLKQHFHSCINIKFAGLHCFPYNNRNLDILNMKLCLQEIQRPQNTQILPHLWTLLTTVSGVVWHEERNRILIKKNCRKTATDLRPQGHGKMRKVRI